MVSDTPTVGDLVKQKRQSRGLSARGLSLAAGQSASYVTKLERGMIYEPSLRSFSRIATELGFTPHELWLAVRLEACT